MGNTKEMVEWENEFYDLPNRCEKCEEPSEGKYCEACLHMMDKSD